MIPIAKPFLGEEEAQAAAAAVRSGWITQGPLVQKFEEAFAAYVGAPHAVAVSNGSVALHLALLSVGVKPGDVVLTVSHSFIATANTIRYCGAEPVFIDINLDTYNMSPHALQSCLEGQCRFKNGALYYTNHHQEHRVAAILVVHQIGLPCDLKHILSLARKVNVPVVEDAACAIGSEISLDGSSWERIGRPHGDIACFSFHPRKIITTGEGGMITTSHAGVAESLRVLRHQGMNISDVERHASKQVIFESYPVLGFNYRLTDIQAAVGLEQLKKLPEIIQRRRALAALYQQELAGLSWVKTAQDSPSTRSNFQSFAVRVLPEAPVSRDELMQKLLDKGIATRPGIMNAHEEGVYARMVCQLPNSVLARKSVILMPLFAQMSDDECRTCAGALKEAVRVTA